MNRLKTGRTGHGRHAWRWIALALISPGVGCKPGSGTGEGLTGFEAASSTDMADETLLAHLKLTGLVGLESKRWALFLVAEPGKPTEYLKLMEGQRLGALEVGVIDAVEQSVSVRVGDWDATLSMATHGLKPEDGYAWLQRLTPDEHTRLYSTPERQRLVGDHAQAQEDRQRQELARELAEREQFLPPSPQANPRKPE